MYHLLPSFVVDMAHSQLDVNVDITYWYDVSTIIYKGCKFYLWDNLFESDWKNELNFQAVYDWGSP